MPTSGTYTFNPATADLMIEAFGRCQIRRTALTLDHLMGGQTACNLLQVEWANRQVNLWAVDLQSIPLVLNTATYNVDAATIMIMAAYISTTAGGVTTDRIITSLDRDTYASFPNKASAGQPSVYWFNQLAPTPVITLWEVPDSNGPYTLKFYRARQQQDAVAASGVKADVPYAFLEAYVAALAAKLSITWAPARTKDLFALAKIAWDEAKDRNIEKSPLRVVPALSTYTDSVY